MLKALIIDDNGLNLETLRILVKKEGMKAITALSPAELPNIIPNLDGVRVVFLDLEFPNYSGLEVIHDLRREPVFMGVPIIAYTVHISEQDEIRRAGFDGFIGKPLSPRKFPEQLRQILAGETVWDAGQ